jgi:hypothetical protein
MAVVKHKQNDIKKVRSLIIVNEDRASLAACEFFY